MVHIRVDKAERDECEKILSGLGTNFSALVNMLMKQVILTKSIPFTVAYPEPVKEDEIQKVEEKEDPKKGSNSKLTDMAIKGFEMFSSNKKASDDAKKGSKGR